MSADRKVNLGIIGAGWWANTMHISWSPARRGGRKRGDGGVGEDGAGMTGMGS